MTMVMVCPHEQTSFLICKVMLLDNSGIENDSIHSASHVSAAMTTAGNVIFFGGVLHFLWMIQMKSQYCVGTYFS